MNFSRTLHVIILVDWRATCLGLAVWTDKWFGWEPGTERAWKHFYFILEASFNAKKPPNKKKKPLYFQIILCWPVLYNFRKLDIEFGYFVF